MIIELYMPPSNQSWNSTQTNATSTVYSGTSSLKQVYTTAWAGLSYTRTINTTPFATFDLVVYVGTSTPDLYLYFTNASGTVIVTKLIASYIPGGYQTNTWQKVSIPLSDLGLTAYNNTLALNIESSIPGTVYYDQIGFSGATNPINQSRQYIGEEYDEATKLSYLNARYYNPSQGQFTSQDPVFWEVNQTSQGRSVLANPQLQNAYLYWR